MGFFGNHREKSNDAIFLIWVTLRLFLYIGFIGRGALRERKMEMGWKAVAEGKALQKKELRLWRALGHKGVKGSLLEAIAQVKGGSNIVSHNDEDGVLRMKIVVKKQDLKQMLELMGAGKCSVHQPLFSQPSPPSLSLEQRLNILRRKHVLRGNQSNRSRRSSWRPALHSIPEEL